MSRWYYLQNKHKCFLKYKIWAGILNWQYSRRAPCLRFYFHKAVFEKGPDSANLLILDDWGLEPLTAQQRSDLLELIDARYDTKSTMIASQLPIENWYDMIGESTHADAILDRLVHGSIKLELKGESMRKKLNSLTDALHSS